MNTSPSTSTGLSRTDRGLLMLSAIAPVAVWLGLLGPAWAYVPAQDGAPASEMNYADLSSVNSAGDTAIQSMYFTWGAWLLAALTLVLAVLAVRVGGLAVGLACSAVGIVGVVVTILAMKGSLSWATLIGGFENTRVGAALVFIGFLGLVLVGVRLLRGSQASQSSTAVEDSTAAVTA